MRQQVRVPSKYTVQLLDFSQFNDEALGHYNKDRDIKATACKTMNSHGFIDTDDGMFVLCSEGVGNKHPISEEHPYQLEFFNERKEEGVTHLGIGPCLLMRFEEDDLRKCVTGETEPLHEFIRTFGDRLDTNYMTFERWLDNYSTRWEGE
jgi:hypothetical protein